jgi:hypothetical protein
MPHPPQLFASANRSEQTGPIGPPGQSRNGAAHEPGATAAHMPLMHPVFVGQAIPHPPQLDESLVGSTHRLPHDTDGGAQALVHEPMVHAAPI